MKKIAIFCAASANIDKSYFESAERVGRWIGESGYELIYGGASLGLMECVAKAAKDAGAHVVGVVPTKLEERDCVSPLIDELIPCHNLSDRKDIMAERADVMVALPGGVGTLDEIFHVVAAASIGYHSKRVIVYNEDGFYDTLIRMLEEMRDRGFMRHAISDYITPVTSLEELKDAVDEL
jgi:hypothetical protein